MICGIDVDALLGGLQDELDAAKKKALKMVDQGIADAKATAEQMKADAIAAIEGWMPPLPDPLLELPEMEAMSVELMEMKDTLDGYASDLATFAEGKIPKDIQAGIDKKIASAKKEFKESWGEGLDKAGVDLDAILSALDGDDIDICAIIPNVQKGVDGAIELLPNMPKFPFEGALGEIKSEISEAATVAKGKLTEFGADVEAGVGAIATQVKNATDDAEIKLARMGKAPSSRRAPMEKPEKPELLTITLDELRARYPRPESMDVSEYESEMMAMYREKKGLAKMINKNAEDRYNTALALWEKQQPLITK